MENLEDMSLRQRLIRLGYTVERVEIPGRFGPVFKGVRVLDPEGNQAHSRPYCSAGRGWEIVRKAEAELCGKP